MDDISISGTLTFRFKIADNLKSVLTPDLIAEVEVLFTIHVLTQSVL